MDGCEPLDWLLRARVLYMLLCGRTLLVVMFILFYSLMGILSLFVLYICTHRASGRHIIVSKIACNLCQTFDFLSEPHMKQGDDTRIPSAETNQATTS